MALLVGATGLLAGCAGAASSAQLTADDVKEAVSPVAAGSSSGTGGGMQSSAADVRVGVADSGRVIALHVGERLVVVLGDGWSAPTARGVSTDPEPPLQPLLSEQAVGYPDGPSSATFLAVRPGAAAVSAHTDAACLHTTPQCLLPEHAFEISVRVQPVSGTGAGPLPVPPPS